MGPREDAEAGWGTAGLTAAAMLAFAAIPPAPVGNLVRPARALETHPQIGQHSVGNVDGEGTRRAHQIGSFLGDTTPLPAGAQCQAAP